MSDIEGQLASIERRLKKVETIANKNNNNERKISEVELSFARLEQKICELKNRSRRSNQSYRFGVP